MKKLLFIILDGIAGRPIEKFKGLTPLEAAKTPNLDMLAKIGKSGRLTLIEKRIPPETEGGVLALFGYNPLVYNRGRGPLEAYGMGLKPKKDDLILRCNFGTIEGKKIIDTRAGRIDNKSAKKLIDSINKKLRLESYPVKMKLIQSLNYRSLLILHPKKGKLSDKISNTHPGYRKTKGNLEVPRPHRDVALFKKCKPINKTKEAKISAEIINEFTEKSHEFLEDHRINKSRGKRRKLPANLILVRGAGVELPKLDNLERKYGTKWLCIGDTPAERGIARCLGMSLIKDLPAPKCDKPLKNMRDVEKAIKYDSRVRADVIIRKLKRYNCIYLHLKGADPFGHKGDIKGKKKIIEGIDKHLFGNILEKIDLEKVMICVSSDHTTACSVKAHTADPVPVLISGGGLLPDRVERFGESFCKKGKVRIKKATKLMPILIRLIK